MTDEERKKMTAAKTLEAIGLNDATVAALLKELKENAMTKSDATQSNAEPNDHEHWLLMQTEECLKTLGWDGSENPPREEWARNLASEIEDMRAALTQSDAEASEIERVARAICRVEHDDPDRRMPTSENPPGGRPVWTAYEREARAAIGALAQPDAEPVAWQYRHHAAPVDEWSFTFDKEYADEREIEFGHIVEPLYTASPRPDVSAEPVACAIANRSNELGLDVDGKVALHGICQEELERSLYTAPPRPDASAGLIEAAEAIEGLLSEWDKFCKYGSPMAKSANERVAHAREVLSKLRARSADRSGK